MCKKSRLYPTLVAALFAACGGAALADGSLRTHPGWLDATPSGAPAKTAPTHAAIVAAARAALAAHGGHGGDADDVRVVSTRAGTHAVIFVPRSGGVEIDGARSTVLLDRTLTARAIMGNVAPAPVAGKVFALDPGTAVKLAANTIDGLIAANPVRDVSTPGDTKRRYALAGSVGFVPTGDASAQPIWYATSKGLEPAWRVTLSGRRPGDDMPVAQSIVVSADDGAVLAQASLIREHQPFAYRVFAQADGTPYIDNYGHTVPHPTGVADGWRPAIPAPMNLVARVHGGIATGDPWLADDATETVGNNADVFFDALPLDEDGRCYSTFVDAYDASEGDLRAQLTGPRTFDYTYDTNATAGDYIQCERGTGFGRPVPVASPQLNAKMVQMFYGANWLHDYFYGLGFTERAGNMQQSNYGRGGIEGDPVILHAGGANAYTAVKSDGESPVITLGINSYSLALRDSSAFDFTTLGHEWTHAVMNRLNPFMPAPSAQYYALGEGTSDYAALMISLRAQDRDVYPGKPALSGAYPGAGAYSNLEYDYPRDTLPPAGSPGNPDNSYYHGVRRFPYSIDPAVNPLRFEHISMDHPLPQNLARYDWKLRSLANAYAHTAGEVWATALWQCSRNIIAAAPPAQFAATRDRVLSNLLAALALFPPNPTYIEARNAMLAATRADDEADYHRCRAGFAQRGMGAGAWGPARDSVDFRDMQASGVDGEHAVSIVGAALVETAGDDDGIADRGDTARLDVTLHNTGFSPATLQLAAAPYLGGYDLPHGGLAAPVTLAADERRIVSFDVRVTTNAGRAQRPFALLAIDTARQWIADVHNAAFVVNADVVRNGNVDAIASDIGFAADWTPGFGPRTAPDFCLQSCMLAWQRTTHAGVAAYRVGDDLHTSFDATLDSAPFVAAANAPLVITLTHDHDLDRAPGDPLGFAGAARLFTSVDGGAWTPVAQYTGMSNGWTTSTTDLGTSLAGRTVRLRLQATVSPSFTADPGYWAVSRIAVQGATPMFTRLVDDVQ
jgi:hypothetical protein